MDGERDQQQQLCSRACMHYAASPTSC